MAGPLCTSEVDHENIYGFRRPISDRIFHLEEYPLQNGGFFYIERTDGFRTYMICPSQVAGRLKYTEHRDAIVIAVDGACRNNGTASAQAAAGIFLGHHSSHNRAYRLESDEVHTSQRAELIACLMALCVVERIKVERPPKSRCSMLADFTIASGCHQI